ncbi:MAG: adenosylcobinamide-GDP ribazoletransferase [Candidatus Omnitrophica bacterium]|nr:adenosylcobinamide-GDP ribazoletransferase [Candidatus Omnitrophota bacterium]
MRHFLIALQFLTILPIKIKSEMKKEDFGRSLVYFPVIGMLIGLALCMVASLFGFLPNLVTAALIIISSVAITGGIHLDGLADTCDGFYGHKPKEKILEIMRDSRIGVMGVAGVVSLLLLKFTLIVSMPKDVLLKSLLMMAVFGRWSQVLACFVSQYARQEGSGKNFVKYATIREFLIASAFTVGLSILLLGPKGILFLVLSSLSVFIFIWYAKKKIGGMTGDTIGAVNEIAESAMLICCIF